MLFHGGWILSDSSLCLPQGCVSEAELGISWEREDKTKYKKEAKIEYKRAKWEKADLGSVRKGILLCVWLHFPWSSSRNSFQWFY